MNDIYHYPPDLFDLVVQTIPLLNRSKKAVLTFFNGAGVEVTLYKDVAAELESNPDSISKYEICRIILERINQNSDKYLRQRREILKRITEFEAFSTCWESDQLKAKGLVSEIQKVINVKDSFTRMKQERDNEQKIRQEEHRKKIQEIQKRKERVERIKKNLFSLFNETNPQKRGKSLESVLNGYFKVYEILVKEDFKRLGEPGEGIIEQLDGIVEVDNQIFLVEMKWKKDSIGSDDIFSHLGRIYHRANAHGIFISASGYSPSGVTAAKEALIKNALLVMFDLEEFVKVIDGEIDFKNYLRDKIKTAIIEKEPYKRMI
ncbi:restriction endonuclease [Litoribacter ruber]|uniref:restriction endonuclease n=1 Tax=Litoribacter ruber TaxID=702568 RepID=UPI001BDADD50|nr:restriction endonuclease [Litoribacter ruber]MBT0810085.1 restriction endonuclease [Litoribacter ruber]